MPWAKIDDTFYDHPKVVETSLAAIGLHAKALSYCNRYLTDGLVPAAAVKRLGGSRRLADELVDRGLWERTGTAYAIHDFLSYSRSKDEVEVDREAARQRQFKRRQSQRDNHGTHGEVTHAPARPVPSTVDSRSTKETERVGRNLAKTLLGAGLHPSLVPEP